MDGDLIADLAIGAPGEDSSTGQVYIAFMRRDGTYRSVTQVHTFFVTHVSCSCD